MDVSFRDSTFYETPNIDDLSSRSMNFSQAYASHPRCEPSRYSIITGMYPARAKLPGKSKGLTYEDSFLTSFFKASGYKTFFVGKWHLSMNGVYPEHVGFEVNIAGGDAGAPKSYFYPYNFVKSGSGKNKPPFINNIPKTNNGKYLTDQLTEISVDMIKKYSDEPFFLLLSHYGVHTPLESKQTYFNEFDQKKTQKQIKDTINDIKISSWTGEEKLIRNNSSYAGMIKSIDQSLGKIIEALKSTKQFDNTIIVFTSDHGGLSNRGNKRSLATSNYPLRAGKGHLYEGGIRIPHFVFWKDKINNGWTDHQIIGTDHLLSLINLVDLVPYNDLPPIDGRSYADILLGKDLQNHDRSLYWHSPIPRPKSTGDRASSAIRRGNYKLIHFYEDDLFELYDINKDIEEKNNLIGLEPNIASEMIDSLQNWKESVHAYHR
tara:strand:+ start:1474 stop:2772 length:1299 start_codon:yes stop_codon:yes gene_type:complete